MIFGAPAELGLSLTEGTDFQLEVDRVDWQGNAVNFNAAVYISIDTTPISTTYVAAVDGNGAHFYITSDTLDTIAAGTSFRIIMQDTVTSARTPLFAGRFARNDTGVVSTFVPEVVSVYVQLPPPLLRLIPPKMSATAGMLAPSLQITPAISTVPVMAAASTILVPAQIITGQVVNAPVMQGSSTMPTPTTSGTAAASAPVMQGSSAMLAPSFAGPLVVFDTVGAGFQAATVTGSAPSWSHTINGNAVVVFFQWQGASSTAPTMTAKVGATTMTQLGSAITYFNNAGSYMWLFAFGLLSPPTGAQTMSIVDGSGKSAHFYTANSMSFVGVSGFGTPSTATGIGSTSMTGTAAAGQVIAQAFAGNTLSFSGYNQTQEWNVATGSAANPMVMGYAAGTGSATTFGAAYSLQWGGVTVPVL